MSILELKNVSRVFGSGPARCPALRGIDLSVEPAEMLAVTGASGSGKSTLLNICAGLDAPTGGSVLIDGRDTRGMSPDAMARLRRTSVGFVFQFMNLLPALTAWENIELALVLSGAAREDRRRRVAGLLDLAGLAEKARALPDQLSGGQQQRLAVLRALAHRPRIVFMDEPTSCLDSDHARELMDLVVNLNAREKTTIVVATHDAAVAGRMTIRVQMRDGKIISPEVTP
ncbi:MAG: ABC transporter ATP-binding protein [Planctomycetaceae bacterium]|nr:ABC transporter ATP-binding protein [Planctomycetaceae bacterium]